jgi:phosphohistidine phosphatase
MELYLLRHAHAEEHSATGRDADRVLSQAGIAGLESTLALAHKAGVRPSLILSSPYARAMQTARLAAGVLEYSGEIVRSDEFTPDSSPFRAWEEIRSHADQASILVAAHEPLLSSIVAWFAGSTRVMIRFVPAAMVRVDFENPGPHPQGVMHWMITPHLG